MLCAIAMGKIIADMQLHSRKTSPVAWLMRRWINLFITRQEAEASPSIGNTVARLNDVHALSYNSAGSERIWMKFGALRVYCLELALTDFGRDPRRSESVGRFAFCQVNIARLYRFLVGQISRNLHTRRGSATW